LLREDLDNIDELAFWPGMKNPLEKLDSKMKAAFTRQVNKEILPYSVMKVGKAKAKTGGDKVGIDSEGLNEDEGEESKSEDEDVGKDAMVKVRKSKAKPGAKSGKKKKIEDDSDDEETASSSKKHCGGKGSSSKSSSKKK